MKPKPAKPATPEPPAPASSQGGESQSQRADNTDSSPGQNANVSEHEVPPAAAEPMETDKSESSPNNA